jgi:hypothetical protein
MVERGVDGIKCIGENHNGQTNFNLLRRNFGSKSREI